MSPLGIIERAKGDGVTLAVDHDRKIKVRGDAAAVARWLPEIRRHKDALLVALAEPHRLWDIIEPSGVCWRSSFCPHVTAAQVQGWYPGATVTPTAANQEANQ